MQQRKGLFILNIIVFIILIACLIFNVIVFSGIVESYLTMKNNPDSDAALGAGIGAALLLTFQLILAIPYGICSIVAIVSMCKKYFNWLSIANVVGCVVGILLTVISFLLI